MTLSHFLLNNLITMSILAYIMSGIFASLYGSFSAQDNINNEEFLIGIIGFAVSIHILYVNNPDFFLFLMCIILPIILIYGIITDKKFI